MSKVRRPCVCRILIETEPDPPSIAHALRVHYAQPEHQDAVLAIEEAEQKAPPVQVPLRSGSSWIGVTASLRRLS